MSIYDRIKYKISHFHVSYLTFICRIIREIILRKKESYNSIFGGKWRKIFDFEVKKYELEKNFLLIIICILRIKSPVVFSRVKNNRDILNNQVRGNTVYVYIVYII